MYNGCTCLSQGVVGGLKATSEDTPGYVEKMYHDDIVSIGELCVCTFFLGGEWRQGP